MAEDGIIDMMMKLENYFRQNVQNICLIQEKSMTKFLNDGGGEYLCNELQIWLEKQVFVLSCITEQLPIYQSRTREPNA